VASGDTRDSTGGGTYRCAACNYSTARDVLVVELLRHQRATDDLLFRLARLALPLLSACALGTCAGTTDPRLARLRALLSDLLGPTP
jgi:hypothetical protein